MKPTKKLGNSDIAVSPFCLGTMTWGTQTDEADAHAQIDMARAAGINFIDTAELYPVTPAGPDTYGDTERIVGTWLAKHKAKRGDMVVATKVAGPGVPYIRDGQPHTPASIKAAVEGSLKRLETDYIDLYQLHWPNRGGFMFRLNWSFDATSQDPTWVNANMLEVLRCLGDLVAAGKIRAIGLSNESCWGTMRWLELAEAHGLPRMASVQNEYSLMYRHYDLDLAEMTQHTGVGLLAYSPLATGMLTGKYGEGKPAPKGSRMEFVPDLWGRTNPRAWAAVAAYADFAKQQGMDFTQMSLAWVASKPFMTSVILGATSKAQLAKQLPAADMTLPKGFEEALTEVHRAHPMPY